MGILLKSGVWKNTKKCENPKKIWKHVKTILNEKKKHWEIKKNRLGALKFFCHLKCNLKAIENRGPGHGTKIIFPKIIKTWPFSNSRGLKKFPKKSKIEKNFQNLLKPCQMKKKTLRNKKNSLRNILKNKTAQL